MTEQDDYETWESWLAEGTVVPDADLMTREELLASLRSRGVTVSARDLTAWQSAGVIPFGVRRWHAKTRTFCTLYPSMMMTLLTRLRQLQQEGLNLRRIGFQLRHEAAQGHDAPT